MKKITQQIEHVHLQDLMLSPAWLRDGQESFPLA